jgi:hypothetical protein
VAVGDVLLHVAGNGLDVGRSVGVVLSIDNFVAREEEEEVVVVCELVDSGEDGLEVDVVVGLVEGGRVLAVERVSGGVSIKSEVDACIVQHLHSLVVVLGVVNGVDTDGVDTKILEVLDIATEAL